MSIHNHVQLYGRAAEQPQLRTLSDGTAQARFRIYLDGSGSRGEEQPDSFTLVAWQDLARRLTEQLRRGGHVLVSGRLRNRKYERDGVVHVRTEIHVSEFHLQTNSNQRQ